MSDMCEMVDLNSFAELVGFPVEVVQKELLQAGDKRSEVSMDELRQVMLKYLNQTMLEND